MICEDVKESRVYEFLQETLKIQKVGPVTHTLMCGGRYSLMEAELEKLQKLLAQAIQHKETAPPITEQRTVHFPMYADLDFNLQTETLGTEVVERICSVMTRQLLRFFSASMTVEEDKSRCLALQRSGAAEREEDKVTKEMGYRHGLHLYWPGIIVDRDMALQIHSSMVAGLMRETWTEEELGPHQGLLPWDLYLDKSVYNSGLRLPGCVKTKKCPDCPDKKTAPHCFRCRTFNSRCLVVPSVYELCLGLKGGVRDEAYEQLLKEDRVKFLREACIRCEDSVPLTPGYRVYEGCPPPTAEPKGKCKAGTSSKAAAGTAQRKMANEVEVHSEAVKAVMRQLLVKHSSYYQDSTLRVFRRVYRNKMTYRVKLSGDGARYCVNKGSMHKSQTVYMDVLRESSFNSAFHTFMHCWCRCPIERGGTKTTCSNYTSGYKSVSEAQVKVLFPHGDCLQSADPSALPGASSAALSLPPSGKRPRDPTDLMLDAQRKKSSEHSKPLPANGMFDPINLESVVQGKDFWDQFQSLKKDLEE